MSNEEKRTQPNPLCKHVWAMMRLNNDPRLNDIPLPPIKDIDRTVLQPDPLWSLTYMGRRPKRRRPR